MLQFLQISGDYFLFRLGIILLPALCLLIFSVLISFLIVRRYQTALKRLYNMNFYGVEFERKRIANDLHDYIGYAITRIKSTISEIGKQENQKSELSMKNSIVHLTDLHNEIRHLVENIYPRELMENNWKSSFQKLGEGLTFGGRNVVIIIEANTDLNMEKLHHLYRLTQEFFANIFLHGDVNNIILQIYEDKSVLFFNFTYKESNWTNRIRRVGRGSFIIKERLRILQGTLSVIRENGYVHQILSISNT